MSIEEKLKAYILKHYGSLREFTLSINMPYSTLTSVLKRGIGSASISNVLKICRALGISADALAEGEIVYPMSTPIMIQKRHDTSRVIMGDIIQTLRADQHVTLFEFSEELGIPVEELERYENGTKQPPLGDINKIANYFGFDMLTFFELIVYVNHRDITTVEDLKNYFDRKKRWHENFANEDFTDEEINEVIMFAKFLMGKREKP